MKEFEYPTYEFVELEVSDVITASCTQGTGETQDNQWCDPSSLTAES